MRSTLRYMMRINNVYNINLFIHYLKTVPIIGYFISSKLYDATGFKNFINKIMIILKLLGKIIEALIGVLIFALGIHMITKYEISDLSKQQIVINSLLCMVIVRLNSGSLSLENNEKIRYMINCVRLDANTIVKSKIFDTMFIDSLIFALILNIIAMNMYEIGIVDTVILIIAYVAFNIIGISIRIHIYSKMKKYKRYKDLCISIVWTLLIIALGLGIITLNIVITSIAIWIIAVIACLLAVISARYIYKFDGYLDIYNKLSMKNSFTEEESKYTKVETQTYEKYIDMSQNVSNKKGYERFSNLFISRHKKQFFKVTKAIIAIEIIITIALVVWISIDSSFKAMVNDNIIGVIPLCMYVLYLLNCVDRATKIMFINCDNIMLRYNFYKKPKAILSMFTQRLKAVIIMDLIQSLPIIIGFILLLFISGGTQNTYEYLLIIGSIISMSIFFSVHNMVLYYIFQPYNENLEVKNARYDSIKSFTYIICFVIMKKGLEPISFMMVFIVFSIVYIIVSIPIVYKIAPNTFRIKV